MARGNPGVYKLLSIMRKMVQEVNDQEICRRLDILMHTEKEDLPSQMVRRMLDEPELFDPSDVPEPYTQYVKHYLYMIKRAQREQKRDDQGNVISPTRKKASSVVRKKVGARPKATTTRKTTATRTATGKSAAKKTTSSARSGTRTARKKTTTSRTAKKKKST